MGRPSGCRHGQAVLGQVGFPGVDVRSKVLFSVYTLVHPDVLEHVRFLFIIPGCSSVYPGVPGCRAFGSNVAEHRSSILISIDALLLMAITGPRIQHSDSETVGFGGAQVPAHGGRHMQLLIVYQGSAVRPHLRRVGFGAVGWTTRHTNYPEARPTSLDHHQPPPLDAAPEQLAWR